MWRLPGLYKACSSVTCPMFWALSMTYCVGWKSDSAVFLVADSAVRSNEPPRILHSSFGERHASLQGRQAGRYVQEETLKLYDLGPCAVTFAGSVNAGRRMIDIMRNEIAAGRAPEQAFTNAVENDGIKRKVAALMAYAVGGRAKLAAFNENEDGKVRWDADSVHIGSINEAFVELTERCISGIRSTPPIPKRQLVQTLALVQSYGIHHYLLEEGVGGCFCGLYIDQDGVHWQPDVLNVVAHPDLSSLGVVGVFARRNVLCLFSSLCQAGSIVFANPELNESGEMFRQRFSDIQRQLEQKHEEAIFDYVTIFNTSKHIAVTVELLGNREHELLKVESHPEVPRTTGIFWSPQLQAVIDTVVEPAGYEGEPHNLCLQFFPHRPLRQSFSPEELAALRQEALLPPRAGDQTQ